MSMFCYQCEQAAKGTGCTAIGVCGKQPDVAALQDLLVYTLKGIAFWADKARAKGVKDQEIDRFMIDGLFTTVTNVDFDAEAVATFVADGVRLRDKAKQLAGGYDGPVPAAAQDWTLPASVEEQVKLGALHGVKDYTVDPDIHSVREITMYGIKGYAAYADHARILGKESDEIYAYTHKALAAQLDDSLDLMANVGLAMEAGKINYLTMELLNQAHVEAYGHPVPTPVQLGTKAGKAILVSG
ncbi:MAG: hydroxylamine reductase, partial [Desulfuromonadales bacterium]